MEVIMANDKFERLGVIDNAFVIWTSRYYKTGDFELYMSATQDNLNLLSQGTYVIRDDDKDNIGVIEDMIITSTLDKGDKITVKGRFASGFYLSSRIIAQQTQMSGNVQNAVRNLVVTNIINPIDTNRKINFIDLGNIDDAITDKIEMQTTGANLLAKIEETSETFKIGFRMPLVEDRLLFEVYKGSDRSYLQNDNPWVIFSDKYDNLKSCEYVITTSSVTNYSYVAGEGEGLDRRIVETFNGDIPKGEYRREVWVDQRNISSNNQDITEEELLNQMKEEGYESLIGISESFEGEVALREYVYKKDFFLGDMVTIQKEKWNGIYINARIVEVIESEDSSGKTTILTFGI